VAHGAPRQASPRPAIARPAGGRRRSAGAHGSDYAARAASPLSTSGWRGARIGGLSGGPGKSPARRRPGMVLVLARSGPPRGETSIGSGAAPVWYHPRGRDAAARTPRASTAAGARRTHVRWYAIPGEPRHPPSSLTGSGASDEAKYWCKHRSVIECSTLDTESHRNARPEPRAKGASVLPVSSTTLFGCVAPPKPGGDGRPDQWACYDALASDCGWVARGA